jgi:aldose 1-epimerase
MEIRRKTVGVTSGHSAQSSIAVDAYVLDTGRGLAITVWTYGASLIEVLVPDGLGHRQNAVLRLPDLASYEDRTISQYLGATLGRFARCVSRGRLPLDGRVFQLDRNIDGHHFHGGGIGFDRHVWEAEPIRDGDQCGLRLRLERPDGDQGYPGAVVAETCYRLLGYDRLEIEFLATTTATTIVGLTNHALWNLAGEGGIDHHFLAINASRVVTVDGTHVPVGPLTSVRDTALDFRSPRRIGSESLDHCFVLDEPTWAARLVDLASGRVLRIRTDQPGLAVYTADGYRLARAGLSLQATALPDAPNRLDFPSVELRPGKRYRATTVYEFSVV